MQLVILEISSSKYLHKSTELSLWHGGSIDPLGMAGVFAPYEIASTAQNGQ